MTNIPDHTSTLESAISAVRNRTFFAHWPEAPSGKIYGETANADGEAAFKAHLGKPFTELLQNDAEPVGSELSPWGFPLHITYPSAKVDELTEQARMAQASWQRVPVRSRAMILIEALERVAQRFFEIGYATMHTTGQGFVMAFQSSGPHAFDRALESVALGVVAHETFSSSATWAKPMGKFEVHIQKHYRTIPKGINLVIGCSTFPVWNSLPGIFAGLITGSSVIVKPHPMAVLPIAIIVAEIQKTLRDVGVHPLTIQLAADSADNPVALKLLEHPAIQVVDYTGGPAFGNIVEETARRLGKVVYSEKAGVNSVIIDSADDLDAALDNLAFSVSLYSGQMCTAPQNIYIPAEGVMVKGALIPAGDVAERLKVKIDTLVGNPKMGPGTLGTIQNPATAQRVADARTTGLPVLRDSAEVGQAGFDTARTASPLLLMATAADAATYHREWFGPISFVITAQSFGDAVREVAATVREAGALSVLIYTTDPDKAEQSEQVLVSAGAPVAYNFNSFVWVNQSAAYSDFHGTGANPAGTASYSDLGYITGRYHVVGVRKQAASA